MGTLFLLLGLLGTAFSVTPTPQCKETLPLSVNLSNYETTLIASTNAEAQKYFRQGVMLCFGFNHDEGIRSFMKAASLDTTCSLCWWAITYANSPDINRAPDTATRLSNAKKALTTAQSILKQHPASKLTGALIGAIAQRFPPSRTVSNYEKYEKEYAAAMEKVVTQFPDNPDVMVFTTQGYMDTAPWSYYGNATTRHTLPWVPTAVAHLKHALAVYPDHPLANHLYIHLVEPQLIPGACDETCVQAGVRLKMTMPQDSYGIGHLTHMPTHTYLLTGQWHEGVEQNILAISIDDQYFKLCGDQTRADYNWYYKFLYWTHKHVFLMWCAGQESRYQVLKTYANQLSAGGYMTSVCESIPSYQEQIPWLLQNMVRFGQWKEILSTPAPVTMFPYYTAFWHWAQASALFATSQCAEGTKQENNMLSIMNNQTVLASIAPWQGNFMFDIATATVRARRAERCENDSQKAQQEWAVAVGVQKMLPYNEPPSWHESVRPCLGYQMVKNGQAKDAITVFNEDLLARPNNGWAWFGLYLAYTAQGDKAEAAQAKLEMDAAWKFADTHVPNPCPNE